MPSGGALQQLQDPRTGLLLPEHTAARGMPWEGGGRRGRGLLLDGAEEGGGDEVRAGGLCHTPVAGRAATVDSL